jgi:hypothetical protein
VPLSDADFLQASSGGFNATSGSATLGVGTTAGNTLILAVTTQGATVTTPSGFTAIAPASAGSNRLHVYRKTAVDAETSWTVTVSITAPVAWVMYELTGIDTDAAVDVGQAAINNVLTTASIGTGTSPNSTTYDGVVLYFHSAGNTTDTTVPTFSGQTDGAEVTDQGQAGAANAVGLSVSCRFVQSLGAFASTATISLTAASANGWVVVLTATGAKRAPDLTALWGAEQQTVAGLAIGVAGSRIFEAVAGTPTIDTTTPRSGAACYELGSGDSLTGLGQTIADATTQAAVMRDCFRFVGGLPAVDTEICSAQGGGAIEAKVWFRTATSKLGLQIETGAEVLSDATVAADTWIAVDLRVMDIGADWAGDWQVTYDATPDASSVPVTQTRATFTTATSLASFAPQLGAAGNTTTVAVRHDDVVVSLVKGHYPLGDHRVYPLLPDPAGTLTITGTASNFALMTANATGGAWDAAAALTNIRDVPPVLGASAAGFCQTAVATSDYVNIPMATHQAAPAGSIRAVKLYACGWAASTAAATIGFRAFDGVTEYTLLSAANPLFDTTSTPGWVCKMVRPLAGGRVAWNQELLDGLVFRVGRSGDATPDIGIHMLMAEVAIQVAAEGTIIGEAGSVEVTEARDPISGGMLGVTVDTPADQGTTLFWDDAGTPGSQVVAPSSSHTETFDAPDVPTVAEVGVISDNEDPDRE